jgi:hypothetical protein
LRLEREQRERDSLIHYDGSAFDRDARIGAKLIMADGTVLVERVVPPSRSGSVALRSVWR